MFSSSSWPSSSSRSPSNSPALTDGLALLIGSVQGVDPGLDERQGGDHRVDPQPGQEFEFIDHAHFLGRDERHVENFVANRHRADQLVVAELLGQEAGKLLIGRGRSTRCWEPRAGTAPRRRGWRSPGPRCNRP